ncbi:ladderlectin-like [Esox lucius]|uniref:C-type lectin domain-containing protein n=1 Tax=Esox lucius TaxID=8010 RepID=A0A6Q2ZB09_ESOLU|nr:ladderlectin-like [Esox lucius]
MLTLTVIVLLSAPFTLAGTKEGSQNKPCRQGWVKFQSRCFQFIRTPRTWMEAESHCLTLGANLVSVHSPEESRFLLQLTDGSPAWIGGSDAVQAHFVKNRQWFWSDGSTFGYQNWAEGEPNNFNRTREPCIQMNYGKEHRWNDNICYRTFSSVCLLKTC